MKPRFCLHIPLGLTTVTIGPSWLVVALATISAIWLLYVPILGSFLNRAETWTIAIIPNQTGEPVAWQPVASTLLFQEIREQTGRSVMHLLRFDLTSAQVVDLSEATNTEDIRPAWSPDGQWIAMVRQELSNPDKAKSRQLWVMRADGREARRLTNQTDVFYQGLRWSPDGQYLYFHQYFLKQLEPPAIWLLHVQTGELQPIISPGSWPTWLP